ncbi:aminoglycoside phosphotransferase family protein [Actinokineospora sp.]|uniref:aminoglycoside phosphotransferase family protein n=1 Tax=Actinokineospora sp. TaxID=1872133 RepID=UPI004037B2B3
MLIVPAEFAADLADREGDAGRRWVDGLPDLAARCLDRWTLTPDGPPLHGHVAVVLPVRRADGTPAMLKLPWPHEEGAHEALTLSLWDGDGAVRLLAHEPADWAMLLERLDPHHSLLDAPIEQAIEVVARLFRRLDRPAPPGMRTVRDVAARWCHELPHDNAEQGHPVPGDLMAQAVAYCAELWPPADSRLVNEDPHYANVLRGEREPWLVIDPKPIAGEPEFGLVPLLWNRFAETDPAARLDALVAAAGLDADRARRWAFVRAVDFWLWSDGDPAGPAIARALA